MGKSVLTLFLMVAGMSPAFAAKCDTDPVPAATLLFPYFQLDLDAPNGRTTLFSITNTQAEPVLANVVLWTDWAISTLQLNVYLAGYDVQTFNMRDIFVHGRLPATGKSVSNHGQLSGAPRSFPGCNDTTAPGLPPVYKEPAISSEERQELAAFHTSQCFEGVRASANLFGDNVARGYITVDVVEQCSTLTPGDSEYFERPVIGHQNALTGDYFLVDAEGNFAQGELAVHVESFPGTFASGEYTFYRRYVSGSGIDSREPLGTQYSFRHLTGAGFDAGTRVIVWRDTGSSAATPLPCDAKPDWWDEGISASLSGYRVYFDEEGNSDPDLDLCRAMIPGIPCLWPTGWATQHVSMDTTLLPAFPFGKTYLSTRRLNDSSDPADWEILQGWVSVTNSAEDRYSVGQRATRLDSACAPGPVLIPPSEFE